MKEEINFSFLKSIVINRGVTAKLYFIKEFKTLPKYAYCIENLTTNATQIIEERLKTDFELEVLSEDEDYYHISSGRELGTRIYYDAAERMVFQIDTARVHIYSEKSIDNGLKDELEKVHEQHNLNVISSSVHILSYNAENGMYLSDFEIDNKYSLLNIDKNYNDDFMGVYKNIVSNLKKDGITGLYLLHGHHGTGKTTLIRHLIRTIEKRVIFVPPSMTNNFVNPEMIPFLMNYPNSVIILEDSENIIRSRDEMTSPSVSNLLNLSDGIMGDCLKFQIICTFNTSKEQIDPALKRKGRLIDSYEFKALSVDKSNHLLKVLGYPETKEPMILSDIYNPEDNHGEVKEKRIGF